MAESDQSRLWPDDAWNPARLFAIHQSAFDFWVRGVSAWTEELGQFMRARITNDLDALTSFASCKTPEQALEWQRQFLEAATRDYFEEANKLSRLTIGLANDSFSAIEANTVPAKEVPKSKRLAA